MKKKLLLLFCVAILGTTQAQELIIPIKERLVIDYFTNQPDTPPMFVQMLRSEVRKGFTHRGRHEVADAMQIPGMTISPEMLYTPHNPQQLEQSRLGACIESGAQKLVWGDVSGYTFEKMIINKKWQYKNTVVVTLGGIDLRTGETLPVENFTLSATTLNDAESKNQIANQLLSKMELYIDRNYKFNCSILEIEPANNKGKYKELYISCGSNMGVRPGDLFMVYCATGSITPGRKIGKLRAKEVQGSDITRCVIANGGEQIAEAFDSGQKVTVVSNMEAFF